MTRPSDGVRTRLGTTAATVNVWCRTCESPWPCPTRIRLDYLTKNEFTIMGRKIVADDD